jgi:TonB-linked SusC/RagA family outer membrane protein
MESTCTARNKASCSGRPLTMTLFGRRQLYLLLFLHFLSAGAFAQSTLNGTVRNAEEDELPGVSIVIKGTTVGTTTDADGKYTLNASPGEILVFSFIGSRSQEIVVPDGRTVIDVTLEEDLQSLQEVVIIGYGEQSKETLTTSISKLDSKTLENVPYSNTLSALQGSIPGLRVQSYNGQPGIAPRIILRGGTTINNPDGASPLYIVDGVIRTNLDDVAADDIESLQVLKDAAATSIYGARASNGVVLVTTKGAKAGTTRISYSYDLSVADAGNQLREYSNAREYIEYMRKAIGMTGVKLPASITNSRLTAPSAAGTGNDLSNNTAFTTQYLSPANEHKLNEGWQSMPDPIDPSGTIIFKETDFQDLTYRQAISHNHYLSASGGTERARFNGSVGYLSAEGIALNSDYKRLTTSFNSSIKITDKLSIDGRMMYSNVDYRFITGAPQAQFSTLTNTFYRSPSLPSTAKYQFEDGTMAPGQGPAAGNPHYYQVGPFAPQAKNTKRKLTISLAGKWDILPGLSFEPFLSSYEEDGHGRTFQPAYLATVTNFNTLRRSTQGYSNNKTYQAEAVFTYAKSIRDHYIVAKAGYAYFGTTSYSVSATGDGASTDHIPTLNASAIPRTTAGSEGQFITEGVFGRLNYDYQAKYLLSLTARYDGASNLGADNRFGFFPGMGIGWNLHKENFWNAVPKQISMLKLRASYGENGNIQNLSQFGWQGLFNVSGQYYGGGAIVPGSVPNPDLSWEETRVFDTGFDLGLFNNRITMTAAYYDKVTANLITNVVLPSSSGYGTVQTNNGSLGNKGVELDLNANVLSERSPFQWSVNLNAAKVSTKVLELPFNGVEGNRQGGVEVWDPASESYVFRPGFSAGAPFNNPSSYMEGYRIGDMYAYQHLGVYATDEEALNAPLDLSVPLDQVAPANGRRKYGGDVIWADRDGNNIIDGRDQVYVGNMFPTWTGGFSNYLSYKNVSLSVRTDFTTGHTIYNYANVVADGQLQGDLMPTKDFIERSWKEQGDITNTPRYLFQNSQGNISRSSEYYEKGDFLALREVTLGYTLPASLLRKANISACRIHITGNNLHYFTKYRGPMPEDGGADNGRYPNPRTFILGVNISL